MSQLRDKNLRSGKGGNDIFSYDFGGVSPISLYEYATNWVLEVYERKRNHFVEIDGELVFCLKVSDYMKWDDCIKSLIPPLYLIEPEDYRNDGVASIEGLQEIRILILTQLYQVREFNRIMHKEEHIEYFIKTFAKLPTDTVMLNEEDFMENPQLNIEAKCRELVSYANQGRLEEYVRKTYFSEFINSL